jgi:membrane-associated phospholipid phosphatase
MRFLVLALLARAGTARAEPAQAIWKPWKPLRHDLRIDLPVTAALMAAWVTTEALGERIGPSRCGWCSRDASGASTLNGLDSGVRDALRWGEGGAPNALSYGTAYALVPMVAIGPLALDAWLLDEPGRFGVDALIIVQTTALAANLTQLAKYTAARERPYVHALDAEGRAALSGTRYNTSFFSGHTSFAFAVATSAGTVASMRGYPYASWIWGGGLAGAAFTSYLRLAADRHYLTDVLAGALVGAGVGIALPRWLHAPCEASMCRRGPRILLVGPLPGGHGLSVTGLL